MLRANKTNNINLKLSLRKIFLISILLLPFTMFYELRIEIGPLHLDFFLIFYLIFMLLAFLKNRSFLIKCFNRIEVFIIFLFLSYCNIMFLIGPKNSWAIEEIFKLNTCIILFLIGVGLEIQTISFIELENSLKKTANLAFLISLILFLISLFKFHTPFWAGNLLEYSTKSKNVVGFILTILYPFYFYKKQDLINFVGGILFLILIFFTLSRETWIALILGGMLTYLHVLLYSLTRKKVYFLIKNSILFLCLVFILYYILNNLVPIGYREYLFSKIYSILYLEDIKGSHSITVRKKYIDFAINRFLENPMGYGLGSFYENIKDVPHNNYLLLLHDTGIVGFLMYILFIVLLYYKLLKAVNKLLKIDFGHYYLSFIWSFLSFQIILLFIDNLTLFQSWFFYLILYKLIDSSYKAQKLKTEYRRHNYE